MSAMSRSPLRSLALAFVALASTGLLTSCSPKTESEQIAEGISCLDSAKTESDATSCISKVEGLTSAKSYLVRCSANFIAQGFVGQRIASAFNSLDNSSNSSGAQTSEMMSFFIFAKPGATHSADTALSNCQKSEVTGMIQLASAAKIATMMANTIASLAGGTLPAVLNPNDPAFDPSQLQGYIDGTNGTPAIDTSNIDASQLGAVAQVAQSSFCGSGSSYSSESICSTLNDAITNGNGNLSQIGTQLLALLTQ